MLTIINDGQTFANTIKPDAGFHHGITYKFRPVGNTERGQLQHELANLDEVGTAKRLNRFIADHLTEWDQVDAEGKRLPITEASVNQLRLRLPDAIFAAVINSETTEDSIGDSVKNS